MNEESQMLKTITHRKGKIMNMELIAKLNEIAENNKIDSAKLNQTADKLREKRAKIKTYGCRCYLVRAKHGHIYHFTNNTDNAYWELRKNFGMILPMSEEDGQVGASFYLETDKEKSEMIKITICRTHGVAVNTSGNIICENVKDAKDYTDLLEKERKLVKMAKAGENIDSLIKKLTETLALLDEMQ